MTSPEPELIGYRQGDGAPRFVGGMYARYGRRLYRATTHRGGDSVLLFVHGGEQPAPGFSMRRAGVWEIEVDRSELDEHFEVQYLCRYGGLDCTVMAEHDDGSLEIVHWAGDGFRARELGMRAVDRDVFQKRVRRDDVTGLREERSAP